MKMLRALLPVVLLLAICPTLTADIIFENNPDAGDLPGTAQQVGTIGDGDSIIGSLTPAGDVDMFAFTWGGGTLQINTFGSLDNQNNPLDTMLSLYNADGTGIALNNNAGQVTPNLNSQMQIADLAAGDYLVAVSLFNVRPLQAPFPNGDPIFSSAGGGLDELGNFLEAPLNSNAVVAAWSPVVQSVQGNYSINFTNVVPEPGCLWFLSVASAAGLLRCRRRRVER